MIHLQKKLHDRHGATLLMALLLVLVAVVVSFIVIQAASSASLVAGSKSVFSSTSGDESSSGNISVSFTTPTPEAGDTIAEVSESQDGTPVYSYTYDGQAHGAEITPIVSLDEDELKGVSVWYSTNGVTYSETQPTLTNVNTLNVQVQLRQGGKVIANSGGYTLKVNYRTVTVTAKNITIPENEYTGIDTTTFEADEVGIVSDNFSLAYHFTTNKLNDYEYEIEPVGNQRQGNYNVNFEKGTLTITPTNVHTLRIDATGMNFVGDYNGNPQKKENGTVDVWFDNNSLNEGYTLTYSCTLNGSAYDSTTAPEVTNVSDTPGEGLVVTVTASYSRSATETYTAEGTYTMKLNKATPSVTIPTEVSVGYGKKLGDIDLGEDSQSIPGEFSWDYSKNPGLNDDTVLDFGPHDVTRVFTPTDSDNYNPYERTVRITIGKTTPELSNLTATAINAGQTLSSSTVRGTAKNPNTNVTVLGTFEWENGDSTKPNKSDSYKVIFRPKDSTNYETVEDSVYLTVNNTDLQEAIDAYNNAMEKYSTTRTYTKITESYQDADGWLLKNYTSSAGTDYWCILYKSGWENDQYSYARISATTLRNQFARECKFTIPSLPSASYPNDKFMAAIELVVASKFDSSIDPTENDANKVNYPTENKNIIVVTLSLNEEENAVVATFTSGNNTEPLKTLTYEINDLGSTSEKYPQKQDNKKDYKNYTNWVWISNSNWQETKYSMKEADPEDFGEDWKQDYDGHNVRAKLTLVKYSYTLELVNN